ncbi:MAG: hypothetical protein QXP80_06145 [Zestosphaera sp.]
MSCPWYKDGLCSSPKLEHPSSDPVSLVTCLGGSNEYGNCKYFSEKALSRPAPVSSVAKFGKALLMIHALNDEPKFGCEFFEAEIHEGYYLAGCLVLKRYLTKFEAAECEKHWGGCPYRRMELALTLKRA